MSVDKYIEAEGERGDLDSTGVFTVDLQAAAVKTSRFQLASPNHHLLKVLQLAALLGATSAQVRLGRRATEVVFSSSGDFPCAKTVAQNMRDPDRYEEPVTGFLAAVFVSALASGLQEVVWTASGQVLRLEAGGQVEASGVLSEVEDVQHEINLIHVSTWRFWEGAKRRMATTSLIEESTRYSGLQIDIDGRAQKVTLAGAINDHVSDFGGTEFNAGTGVMQNTRRPGVASNMLYCLSSENVQGVRLGTPTLAAFRQREGCIVWAQGEQPSSLSRDAPKPDGTEVSTWMLQFVSQSVTFVWRRCYQTHSVEPSSHSTSTGPAIAREYGSRWCATGSPY